MITTVNLGYIRQLCQNPQPFIQSAIAEANKWNYNGYNIDFEPNDAGSDQDAQNFAAFLTTFADALHAHGKTLSVDVGM